MTLHDRGNEVGGEIQVAPSGPASLRLCPGRAQALVSSQWENTQPSQRGPRWPWMWGEVGWERELPRTGRAEGGPAGARAAPLNPFWRPCVLMAWPPSVEQRILGPGACPPVYCRLLLPDTWQVLSP